MNELIVWREKLQKIYADKSLFFDKGIQFLLGLITFYIINQNIGLMKAAASTVVVLALAVICAFLPPVFTVFAAALLVLAHMFALSLGVMAVGAMIFVMMFIFYCRFTPKRAMVLLLTPLAFFLHVPYVAPIVCGLILSPAAAIPVVFGTIIYQMIMCVKNSAAAITSVDGIVGQVTFFVKAVLQNKEMWITAISFIICVLTVYTIKRISIDHAWKIAVAAGAVVNIVVIVIGDIAFDVHTSYGMLILGNLIAIAVGLVLEFFLFSVDYSRTEHLQYEDDDYYYYVKAVPKISIAAPEKTVKHINERRDSEEEELEEDEERAEVRRKPVRRSNADGTAGSARPVRRKRTDASARKPKPKTEKTRMPESTDELLLAQQLQDELDIENIVKKELEDK